MEDAYIQVENTQRGRNSALKYLKHHHLKRYTPEFCFSEWKLDDLALHSGKGS